MVIPWVSWQSPHREQLDVSHQATLIGTYGEGVVHDSIVFYDADPWQHVEVGLQPFRQTASQFVDFSERIRGLEAAAEEQRKTNIQRDQLLAELRDALTETASTSITALSAPDREIPLRMPLTAIIQHDENEVGARIPEFSASGFGATESDAIADLKEELGALYLELIEIPDDELGQIPKRWKRGLEYLVVADVIA